MPCVTQGLVSGKRSKIKTTAPRYCLVMYFHVLHLQFTLKKV